MGEVKQKTRIIRRLRGGRITIPAEFRRELGIGKDTLLELTLDGGELHLKPVEAKGERQGSPWFKELYDYFAPARAEALAKGYTDEEINAWIDAAVAAVRAEHG